MARTVGTAKSFHKNAQTYIDQKLKAFNPLLKKDTGITKYIKYEKYQDYPEKFARDVLGLKLWSKQDEILHSLTIPPYRTLAKASHAVGKSYVSAVSVLWMFFCFPYSITITTAPTNRQVATVLWGLLRELNTIDKDVFVGTSSTKMQINSRWYALGFTPSGPDALNGIHSDSGDMLIVYDEATGIKRPIWEATSGLDNDKTRWLCIFNPTETSSQVFKEWHSTGWNKISISGLEHPNIVYELQGKKPPYPGAIRLRHYSELLNKWSQKVTDKPLDTDVEFPPNSGIWLRPNNVARARCLGEFPLETIDSVWSTKAVELCLEEQPYVKSLTDISSLVMAVDIARKGVDSSVLAIRDGKTVLETHKVNGLTLTDLAIEIKNFAKKWATEYETNPKGIEIKLDVTGMGWGVMDILESDGYNVIPIDFGSKAQKDEEYANKRSEMYCTAAELGRNGGIDLSRLDPDHIDEFQKHSLALLFEYDTKGRRIIESKKSYKLRIGESPDLLDAIVMLFYEELPGISVSVDMESVVDDNADYDN